MAPLGCEVWHKVITGIRIEEEGEMDIVWHHETKGKSHKKSLHEETNYKKIHSYFPRGS